MKKAVRIIIPSLMVIAILLCLGWYLFRYDSSFTRDMLLSSARYFEKQGSHKIASSLYDLAYRQTVDNENIAIELSRYYIKSGNYTQAENTLAAAIADGGNEQLYIALCNTYMEQDKILDAISLLDNISNPEIKAKIDAVRPTAPTPSMEPGFYSQYISVGLSSENNVIFANADGEYPSIHQEPFSDPLRMKDGENTIYAIAVSKTGLVSPLAILGYTVGGVIEEVQFTDAAIEREIRLLLEADDGDKLFTNDLWKINSFTIPDDAVKYDDIAKLAFIQELTFRNGVSGQFSVISGLANLTNLTIENTSVTTDELEMIGKLPLLESLTLSGCGLSTTSGLESAVSLKYLDLSNNTIRNITPLSALSNLQELFMQHNVINELTALTSMSQLKSLDISYNTLVDLSVVTNLTALKYLKAENNGISTIEKLGNLKDLTSLDISQNTVSDVSPLAECVKLEYLDLSSNEITDITALSVLTAVTDLDISHNQITALPQWPTDCAIVNLIATENLLSDLTPLKDMMNLNKLFVDYNPDLSEVNLLSGCARLVQVNAYGTKVKDATDLINLSIVVNYNPTQND